MGNQSSTNNEHVPETVQRMFTHGRVGGNKCWGTRGATYVVEVVHVVHRFTHGHRYLQVGQKTESKRGNCENQSGEIYEIGATSLVQQDSNRYQHNWTGHNKHNKRNKRTAQQTPPPVTYTPNQISQFQLFTGSGTNVDEFVAAGKQPQQINVGQRGAQGAADDLHAVARQVVVTGDPTLGSGAEGAGLETPETTTT